MDLYGNQIGYFGQPKPWKIGDAKTHSHMLQNEESKLFPSVFNSNDNTKSHIPFRFMAKSHLESIHETKINHSNTDNPLPTLNSQEEKDSNRLERLDILEDQLSHSLKKSIKEKTKLLEEYRALPIKSNNTSQISMPLLQKLNSQSIVQKIQDGKIYHSVNIEPFMNAAFGSKLNV